MVMLPVGGMGFAQQIIHESYATFNITLEPEVIIL